MKFLTAIGSLVLVVSCVAGEPDAGAASAAKTMPDHVNSLGMPFVVVPAGSFTMGTPPGEWGRGRNEGPQREVTISRPFYMCQVETVNKWFRQFLKETGYNPEELNEADFQFQQYPGGDKKIFHKGGRRRVEGTDEHPAIWLSWYAALRFCNWLSRKENKKPVYGFDSDRTEGEFELPVVELKAPYAGGYRLPTEAEWEYAARAGTTTAFFFGPDGTKATEYNYADHRTGDMLLRKLPPDRPPNPWGLYHMTGNVGEWCWDRYGPNYQHYDQMDPLGPHRGQFRVSRDSGCMGAVGYLPRYSRCGARSMDFPTTTRYNLGFRVVFNK